MPNSFFKFVVADDSIGSDLTEIESLTTRYGITRNKVILMAEGTEASVLTIRTANLTKICEQRGFRVTPRLHIMLWGNKRGT